MSEADEESPHILVVDDDARLRQLLHRYLVQNGYLVTVAADAAEAKTRAKSMAFDLMVVDIMMPGQDGLSLTEELRGESEVPILLLTARGAPEDRIRGLEAGADDYLPKPFEPRELLLRIATILRRVQATRIDDIVRFGPFTFNRRSAELRRNDDTIHLTTGEISLLQALAAKPGRAVSRAELGDKGVVAGSDRAVDVQMARLRRKIEDDPRQPRHILTMRGSGYVLRLGGLSVLSGLRQFLNRTVVPRGLFWRSLLIVVVPLLILQLLLTVVFYNRHWDTVTRWLAVGVAGEVALLAEMIEEAPDPASRSLLIARARRNTGFAIELDSGAALADAVAGAAIDTRVGHIDGKILEGFAERLHYPFAIDLETAESDRVAVYVQLEQGVLGVLVPRKRVTSTTTWLLLAWMVGGSLVLSAIAVYFLRLQVRPIRQLARAADSFGKGRDVGDFRPRGASEIRQAAHAFNLMRHRILRHISQRTEMLAAVSHDLRTPLTRMRLELELVGPEQDPALSGLRQDVGEMSKLVDEYLGFARGEGRESVEPTELCPILESMRQRAERSGVALEIAMDRSIVLPLRPTAFHRCLGNLVDNACRYASWIGITVKQKEELVEIAVDDDGPGIPEKYREKVFEPFVRLDEQPAGENGGTGLGLTIARDVVLSHGGELRLDQSRRGGLRVLLRMPA